MLLFMILFPAWCCFS